MEWSHECVTPMKLEETVTPEKVWHWMLGIFLIPAVYTLTYLMMAQPWHYYRWEEWRRVLLYFPGIFTSYFMLLNDLGTVSLVLLLAGFLLRFIIPRWTFTDTLMTIVLFLLLDFTAFYARDGGWVRVNIQMNGFDFISNKLLSLALVVFAMYVGTMLAALLNFLERFRLRFLRYT